MQNITIGRRRPFVEELPPNKKSINFSEDDVNSLKDYYLTREQFYQLAILAVLVFAFLIGRFFN